MNINLNKYTKTELAGIWNTLNCWEWHELLGEKPVGFDDMLPFHDSESYKLPTKSSIIRPINKSIEDEIGMKECLRWLHINKLGRTNFEFEKFWFKNNIQKILGLGFHSRKNKKYILSFLSELKDKNHEDNVNGRFK